MAEMTLIPLLNAQQLSMSMLGQAAANLPENAQAMTRQMALDLLREQAHKIEKPEASAKSSLISEDGEGGGGRGYPGGSGQRKGLAPNDDDPAPSHDPLVGKLLNVKV